ncbi:MAG TPA: hypothetical protein P5044_03610 [bacterium]|nr:hypothetical protein [bacterium]
MLFIKIEDLLSVSEKLEKTGLRFVFIGGGIIGFLVDDPIAPPVRTTQDIDLVLDMITDPGQELLESKLRAAGFQHDMSDGAPLCRWITDEVKVDILSVKDSFFKLNNNWLAEAVSNPQEVTIRNKRIFIARAPFFLAMKLEAFADRGKNDFLGSRDIEDVVTVIDGRIQLLEEIQSSKPELIRFIAESISSLMKNSDFMQSLPGHLPPDPGSQKRYPFIVQKLKKIAELNN